MGVTRASLDQLRGGSVSENAAALNRLLDGEQGPFADLVAVNAGAAILVAGLADTLLDRHRAGAHLDRHAGKAKAALNALEAGLAWLTFRTG